MSGKKKKNVPAADAAADADLDMGGDELAMAGADLDMPVDDDAMGIQADPAEDLPEFQNDTQHPLPDDLHKLKASLSDQIRQDTARFQAATDTEYWFCVQFDSREQKEAFLKAMNWLDLGDKYLYGDDVAERQGIDLPDAYVPFVPEKPDPALNSIAGPLKKQTADPAPRV